MTLHPDFLTIPLAHRALHDKTAGLPENTLGAARAAVERGYGIEVDVQGAADGTPMVFHDFELQRLTEDEGAVKDRSVSELAALKVLGSDEKIPRLAQLLDLVAGQVPLLIEVKDQSRVMGPVDGRVEAGIAALLARYSGPVAVMSFNPHSVQTFGEHAPKVTRGLVTGSYDEDGWKPLGPARLNHLREVRDFDTVGAAFISHDRKDLDDPAVAMLKDRGVPVLCWTVRSVEQEAAARRVADNITFEGYFA